MSKKTTALTQDLMTAHLNALNSTLSAVEIQVAAVKTVLKTLNASGANTSEEFSEDFTDAAAEDESFAKAKKPTAKKAAAAPTEDEDESEDEETMEEEEDEVPPAKKSATKAPTVDTVIKALQTYSANHGRPKAMKVLAKFNVQSVHTLKPTQYAAVIAQLN